MTIKEQYIELFDYIRRTFSLNGYNSDVDFPSTICDYFETLVSIQEGKNAFPDFIFVIKNIQTNRSIRIQIVAFNKLFSESNKCIEFRKNICAEDFSGIVSTKKAFFYNSTSATLGIIIFNEKSKTKYFSTVESSEDLYNVIFNHSEAKTKIYYTDTVDVGNLTPENYNDSASSVKKLFSNYETKKLGEIAEIINGAQPPQYELVESGIPFIKGGCLKNGKIVPDGVCVGFENCEKYAKQILQEGDILVTKFFDQKKIVFVTENDLPAIASGMLAIIRPHSVSDINLYKYLSSNAGKIIFNHQLDSVTHRGSVASVSLTSLKNIEIPLFDVNTLDSFNTIFEEKYKHEFEEIKELAEKELDRISENELEKSIKQNFLEAGWNKEEIISEYRIYMKKKFFIPDLMLFDSDKPLACVEIKVSHITQELLVAFIKENMKQEGLLFILTLGSYYEVYKAFNKELKVYKFYKTPTKDELLKIQKEGK